MMVQLMSNICLLEWTLVLFLYLEKLLTLNSSIPLISLLRLVVVEV